MSTTNRRMQLVCILLSLLLVAVENANASSNSEQKYELDLIHEQIGFLLDENQNQNHEIAALKKIVRAQARPVIDGTGIHFHVFRSHYKISLGYRPYAKPMFRVTTFEKIYLNMGDSFNEKSGWFLAPKSGVYQFICTTVMARIPNNADPPAIAELDLILTDSTTNKTEAVGQSTTKEAGNPMTIAATFKLKKGDKIHLTTQEGGSYEIKWASFTGSLLEVLQ